jgi:Holliday junction resolvase RusA-like endonuclease
METLENKQNILGHWIIYGKPAVKKNNQRTIWHKYLKRMIVVYDTKYTAWEKDCLKQLGLSANGRIINDKDRVKNIDFPIILKCHFFVNDNRTRDLSNFYESIQDVLVKAGILVDDNYKIISGHDGSRMFVDPKNPRIEFWILKTD